MSDATTKNIPPEQIPEMEDVMPKTFLNYVKSFGPGIVMVLTWLGAGDLVDSSVAGAQYGYALMWGLVLALLSRWWIVDNLAKYSLCNEVGDNSILQGYQRVWKGLPLLMGLTVAVLGIVFCGAYIKGLAHVIFLLTGNLASELFWGILVVILASALVFARSYKYVERYMKILLLMMVLAFVVLISIIGMRPFEILKGAVLFQTPSDVGGFGAMLVVIALIGGVGGSIANILYPYFMRDKGWVGPKYRKLARYDLLFGIIVIIILNLVIWTAAAEVLNPRGIIVEDMDSLSKTLGTIFGKPGEILMLLGIFGAIASSLIGFAVGYATVMTDALHVTWNKRKEQYGEPKKDPIYPFVSIGLFLVLPLIFMIPGMPNFIWLTIFGSAIHTIVMPFIAIGLIWMVNNPKLLPAKYLNKWWENVFLGALVLLSLWAFWKGIVSIGGMLIS